MAVQGLNIQLLDSGFHDHYNMEPDFSTFTARLSQSASSGQYLDPTGFGSFRRRSESGSVRGSPSPGSPMPSSANAAVHSPSSSCGGFSSPHMGRATSPVNVPTAYYGSPSLDPEGDTPSPAASSSTEDRTRKSSQSGKDYPVCCLFPGCNAKPFKRRADLDRHYKHRHAPDSKKDSYSCDYPRCSRRRDPFHRLDHFRDHLREFHKEDIEKRGGSVNEEWLEDRRVSTSWWRCSKCLKRINIDKNAYECPSCKTSCEPKRKEARRRSAAES